MRIKYVDKLRGVAILLVVIGHITEKSFNIENTPFYMFYGELHLPLLMFLSGIFVLNSVKKINLKIFIKLIQKKFFRIMMPFFFVGGTYVILKNDFNFVIREIEPYWFLPALFYCMIVTYLYYIIIQSLENKFIKYLIAIILWILLVAFYYLHIVDFIPFYLHFIKMYPFFALGILYNKNKDIFSLQITIFFAVIGYIASMILPLEILHNYKISGFFACIILIVLFEEYDNNIPKFFETLGKNSLEIYVFHYFLLPSLLCLSQLAIYSNNNVIYNGNFILIFAIAFIISYLISIICIVISKVFKKSRVFNFLLFGGY